MVDHVASHVGKAVGISTFLRGFPHHVSKGRVLLPLDIMNEHRIRQEDVLRAGPRADGLEDAIFAVAARANDHLITARTMMKQENQTQQVRDACALARGVFLNAVSFKECVVFYFDLSFKVPVRLYLQDLERAQFDPFALNRKSQHPRLIWNIWRAYSTGHF
jgi:NADH dehydrogenase [ubiquinone] 1 alpha subcomplex assembly factor 6